MEDSHPLISGLRGSMGEVTRKKRKILLGASAALIFVIKSGMTPTEITALGIKLTPSNQNSFIHLSGFVVVYYLVSFLIYGICDYLEWRIKRNDQLKITYRDFFDKTSSGSRKDDSHITDSWVPKWPIKFAPTLSSIKFCSELIFPVALGFSAIYLSFSQPN